MGNYWPIQLIMCEWASLKQTTYRNNFSTVLSTYPVGLPLSGHLAGLVSGSLRILRVRGHILIGVILAKKLKDKYKVKNILSTQCKHVPAVIFAGYNINFLADSRFQFRKFILIGVILAKSRKRNTKIIYIDVVVPVLRIRNVYPGSWIRIFPIPDPDPQHCAVQNQACPCSNCCWIWYKSFGWLWVQVPKIVLFSFTNRGKDDGLTVLLIGDIPGTVIERLVTVWWRRLQFGAESRAECVASSWPGIRYKHPESATLATWIPIFSYSADRYALVFEPKCGGMGGVAGSQPMSTVQL